MGEAGEFYVETDDKCECGSTEFMVVQEKVFYVEATTGELWGDEEIYGSESYKVICSKCKKELYRND